jgi:CheY-like chemotaxis protein
MAMEQTHVDNLDEFHQQLLVREQSARAQAEAANRIKDEFLATLSHEIRTPLNSILGWVTLLRNHSLTDSEVQRALEVIERNARSQSHLINDLLDVSSIINGKLRLDVQLLMPEAVITKAVESVRPATAAKNISLQTDLDAQAGPVLADADRLQQIVWNLLLNAIKFTPKDGQVKVKLKRAESHLEIIISDTGIGIEPDLLPFVFDRFRQGDSSTTRKFGGLGLGLAIVRHLVEMHGGTVLVESEGLNRGAAFTVRLPLAEALSCRAGDHLSMVNRELPGWECGEDLAGLRVLVVEDDHDSCQLLVAILTRCHAEVQAAANAVEALTILEEWRPDVIISDIEMPVMNGFEFIRNVRNRKALAKIPAVALTAYTRVEDRLRALAAGFHMHLAKPAEPAELLAVVASLTKRIGRN